MFAKRWRHSRPQFWIGALLALMALTLSGCIALADAPPADAPPPDAASDTLTAIPEIAVEVSDEGISVPERVPGGIVGFTVTNTGARPHGFDLWRIREGHTQDEVLAFNEYLKENPADFFGVFDLSSWVYYVDPVEPGASVHFYADMGVGDFYSSDETNPDLVPVFFSATELVGITEPDAAVMVDMADFAYIMPDTAPVGKQLWGFTNSGEQWHLAAIIAHHPDASEEDILMSFGDEDSPPPADAMVQILGGMPPMSPGERVWMEIELEPGEYELVCPLPDVTALASGGEPLPHLLHGMRHMFTVGQ